MTEHEPLASRWRRSVVTAHDLLVRTADADDQSFDEEIAGTGPRVRRFEDLDCAGLLGNDGESTHIKAYPFAGVSTVSPHAQREAGKRDTRAGLPGVAPDVAPLQTLSGSACAHDIRYRLGNVLFGRCGPLLPTDPVFAAAVVGRDDVPLRLRRLLTPTRTSQPSPPERSSPRSAPELTGKFEPLGEVMSKLTKFFALLDFGAFITLDRISDMNIGEWIVAVLAIALVRPAAMLLSLLSSRLNRHERLTAA